MFPTSALLPVLGLGLGVLVAPSFAVPYDYSGAAAPAPAAAAGQSDYDYQPAAQQQQHSAAAASAPSQGGYDYEYQAQGQQQHDTAWSASTTWAASAAAAATSAWPTHGSGSTPSSDLDACYQKCQAKWGAPSYTVAPVAPTTVSASAVHAVTPTEMPAAAVPDHAGAAATHTIIVAPTQGVLRFVPFSVKAEKGDWLEFVWGAGPHTATLSQGQSVCNKSSTPDAFDSGKLNSTATYKVQVNATTPSFHYCTVGQHCANGMYGVINPPTTNVTNNLTAIATRTQPEAAGSTAGAGSGGCNASRMDCWVATWAASSPQASATVSAVQQTCQRSGTDAWKWGSAMDMTNLLGNGVTKENVMENVLYTRLMLSMNPSMLSPSAAGSPAPAYDPSSPSSAAAPVSSAAPGVSYVAAPDLKSFVAQFEANATPATAPAPSSAMPEDSASASAGAAAAGASNGAAGRIAAPSALIGLFGAAVAMLL